MDYDEIVSGQIQELRRGTLILLVLSQLKQPTYGYSLVKALQEREIPIETNTLYPLLRRLEAQGLLTSEWETSGTKPRKYYVLTDDGEIVLKRTTQYWYKFSENVDQLLRQESKEPESREPESKEQDNQESKTGGIENEE